MLLWLPAVYERDSLVFIFNIHDRKNWSKNLKINNGVIWCDTQ